PSRLSARRARAAIAGAAKSCKSTSGSSSSSSSTRFSSLRPALFFAEAIASASPPIRSTRPRSSACAPVQTRPRAMASTCSLLIRRACASRHVRAARGSQIAHAGDDGFLLLLRRPPQLAPDQIGGGAVSARRVDAHHDGPHRRIVGRLPDAPRDRIRCRGAHGAEGVALALAAQDGPLDAHHDDARLRTPLRLAQSGRLGADLLQRYLSAEELAHLLLE